MTVACLRRLARRDDGQDLLEYGLLASLIALAVMGVLTTVSDTISNVLWRAIAAVKF
jgi:Flp pilus assembly pilin Flp